MIVELTLVAGTGIVGWLAKRRAKKEVQTVVVEQPEPEVKVYKPGDPLVTTREPITPEPKAAVVIQPHCITTPCGSITMNPVLKPILEVVKPQIVTPSIIQSVSEVFKPISVKPILEVVKPQLVSKPILPVAPLVESEPTMSYKPYTPLVSTSITQLIVKPVLAIQNKYLVSPIAK